MNFIEDIGNWVGSTIGRISTAVGQVGTTLEQFQRGGLLNLPTIGNFQTPKEALATAGLVGAAGLATAAGGAAAARYIAGRGLATFAGQGIGSIVGTDYGRALMTPDGLVLIRRRRRMNVLNPRALRRSVRRVKGFSKFAKRVGSFTDPGKSYKLKGFGRRRRRR